MDKQDYKKLSFQEKYDLFALEGWTLEDFPSQDRYDIGIEAAKNGLLSKKDILEVLFHHGDKEYLQKVLAECPKPGKRR